jgi:hypothetical protein
MHRMLNWTSTSICKRYVYEDYLDESMEYSYTGSIILMAARFAFYLWLAILNDLFGISKSLQNWNHEWKISNDQHKQSYSPSDQHPPYQSFHPPACHSIPRVLKNTPSAPESSPRPASAPATEHGHPFNVPPVFNTAISAASNNRFSRSSASTRASSRASRLPAV